MKLAICYDKACASQANQCVQVINQLWTHVRCDVRLGEVKLAART
jgi:hypothetical protein